MSLNLSIHRTSLLPQLRRRRVARDADHEAIFSKLGDRSLRGNATLQVYFDIHALVQDANDVDDAAVGHAIEQEVRIHINPNAPSYRACGARPGIQGIEER